LCGSLGRGKKKKGTFTKAGTKETFENYRRKGGSCRAAESEKMLMGQPRCLVAGGILLLRKNRREPCDRKGGGAILKKKINLSLQGGAKRFSPREGGDRG